MSNNTYYNSQKEALEAIGRSSNSGDISNNLLAKLTAGLSLINIEDILLQANDSGVLDRKMILDRKKELIRKEYSEIIELYDTDGYGLKDFAGQDHIKEYFQEEQMPKRLKKLCK